ncbi:MAG: phosphatidylserine/phosphatidylglycerophosphate/cardiolipin synthase-like enzyme [Myxococcota bacterium]|jgi:phosphatidylserine/phosphatidylglycerophosphate/cardiolipin synthase-like enzyme
MTTFRPRTALLSAFLLLSAVSLSALSACDRDAGSPTVSPSATEPAPGGAWDTARAPYTAAGGKAQLFFTRPGTTSPTGTDPGEDPEVDDAIFELLSGAQHSVAACLYEFNRDALINGVMNVNINQVPIRFVGDGDELEDEGYELLDSLGVQMSLRKPKDRIMHNKFVVIDERWVIMGSMNFSENGVMKNNNHVVIFDSPALAAQYLEEFDQMFGGKFGRKKAVLPRDTAQVGDTTVNAYFSPKDDIEVTILGLLEEAQHSVHFMIFSFTHKAIRDQLVRLHDSGVEVVGVYDKSQARGRYSTDEQLTSAGLPIYIDGNENTKGWAGGKLHHKVMIIDGNTNSNPTVIIGSYNWSANANEQNDENLVVLEGQELVAPFVEEFCRVMEPAVPHPDAKTLPPDPCMNLLRKVRVNEIMANPAGSDGPNEFVELVNTGSVPVNIGGWQLGDKTKTRHIFADRVLPAAGAVVIWSGAGDGDSGGSRILASSGALSLGNSGDRVILRDDLGAVVDQVDYSRAASGVSFNRADDGTETEGFELHDDIAPDFAGSSPGRQIDGARWPGDTSNKDIIINELLPNPDSTDAGQEFVELVNVGPDAADLSGWIVTDGEFGSPRHIFADGTMLPPGEALVVFDKGDHTSVPGAINSTSSSLSLNNAGDTITLFDAEGTPVDVADYSGSSSGISLNRQDDGIRGAALVAHNTVDSAVGSMSPGIRANGDGFALGARAQVIINELLPNPAGSDLGQEYVELVNVGDAAADLSDWTLGDAVVDTRHIFETGTTLLPGHVIVVFDRGTHDDVPQAILSTSGVLSLNNSGDVVTLKDQAGQMVNGVSYSRSSSGVSLNRAFDGDPDADLVDHDNANGAAGDISPGVQTDGGSW